MRLTHAFAVGIAVLVLAGCASAPPRPARPEPSPATPKAAPASRPNIVFIVTDDQDVRAMEAMPKTVELLGSGGLSFDAAYVSSPLCAPSRASILTGRFPHNTGVYTNSPPGGGFGEFYRSGGEKDTVATRLHAAGYRTALVGKYINDYPRQGSGEYVPPGWDEWYATTSDAAYFDFMMNRNGVQRHYEGPESYSTDVIRDLSVDFIRRAHDAALHAPFFLYIATVSPHFPAHRAPRHVGLFSGQVAPRVPSFNEADVSDKPAWLRAEPVLNDQTIRQIDSLYRRRLQSMLSVDEMVEALLRTLAETGELDHTYVFFTSDNGFQQGEHRLAKGKGVAYEESVRVPLLVRGPGVPSGSRLPHLVSNVDFFPTWLQLAGAAVPGTIDGQSMMPLFGAHPPGAADWRRDLLIEYQAPDDKEIPRFEMLRTPNWAYTEYGDGERELYDMQQDPYQLDNRASTAPASLLDGFASRLAKWRHCAGDCR